MASPNHKLQQHLIMKRLVIASTTQPTTVLLALVAITTGLMTGCGPSKSETADTTRGKVRQEEPGTPQPKRESTASSWSLTPEQKVLLTKAQQFFSCVSLPEDIVCLKSPDFPFKLEVKGKQAQDFRSRLTAFKVKPTLETLASLVSLFDEYAAKRIMSEPNLEFKNVCSNIRTLSTGDPIYVVLKPEKAMDLAPCLLTYKFKEPANFATVHNDNDLKDYTFEIAPELEKEQGTVEPDGRISFLWSPLVHKGILLMCDEAFSDSLYNQLKTPYEAELASLQSKLSLGEINRDSTVEKFRSFCNETVKAVEADWTKHISAYSRATSVGLCVSKQRAYRDSILEMQRNGVNSTAVKDKALYMQVSTGLPSYFIKLGATQKGENPGKVEVLQADKAQDKDYFAQCPERWLPALLPNPNLLYCPLSGRMFKLLPPADIVRWTVRESSMKAVKNDSGKITIEGFYFNKADMTPWSFCPDHNCSTWVGAPADGLQPLLGPGDEKDTYYAELLVKTFGNQQVRSIADLIGQNGAFSSQIRVDYEDNYNYLGNYYVTPEGGITTKDAVKAVFEIFSAQKEHAITEILPVYYKN
jgi:hypothetical protein